MARTGRRHPTWSSATRPPLRKPPPRSSEPKTSPLDIVSSGADIVKGVGEAAQSAIPAVAESAGSLAQGSDLLGDFTGDIATTPENYAKLAKAVRLGKAGLQEDPVAAMEGAVGLASLASSLDTYGHIVSVVVNAPALTGAMVTVGSYISEWNPVIGVLGGATKTIRSAQDLFGKYNTLWETLDPVTKSATPAVADAAEKLEKVRFEKSKANALQGGFGIAEGISSVFGPISKGATQVVTKTASSSWGGWLSRGLMNSNRFTAGYVDTYEVATQKAELAEAQLQTALLALAPAVVTAGSEGEIKALHGVAKELELDNFAGAIETAVNTEPDPRKTTLKAALGI